MAWNPDTLEWEEDANGNVLADLIGSWTPPIETASYADVTGYIPDEPVAEYAPSIDEQIASFIEQIAPPPTEDAAQEQPAPSIDEEIAQLEQEIAAVQEATAEQPAPEPAPVEEPPPEAAPPEEAAPVFDETPPAVVEEAPPEPVVVADEPPAAIVEKPSATVEDTPAPVEDVSQPAVPDVVSSDVIGAATDAPLVDIIGSIIGGEDTAAFENPWSEASIADTIGNQPVQNEVQALGDVEKPKPVATGPSDTDIGLTGGGTYTDPAPRSNIENAEPRTQPDIPREIGGGLTYSDLPKSDVYGGGVEGSDSSGNEVDAVFTNPAGTTVEQSTDLTIPINTDADVIGATLDPNGTYTTNVDFGAGHGSLGGNNPTTYPGTGQWYPPIPIPIPGIGTAEAVLATILLNKGDLSGILGGSQPPDPAQIISGVGDIITSPVDTGITTVDNLGNTPSKIFDQLIGAGAVAGAVGSGGGGSGGQNPSGSAGVVIAPDPGDDTSAPGTEAPPVIFPGNDVGSGLDDNTPIIFPPQTGPDVGPFPPQQPGSNDNTGPTESATAVVPVIPPGTSTSEPNQPVGNQTVITPVPVTPPAQPPPQPPPSGGGGDMGGGTTTPPVVVPPPTTGGGGGDSPTTPTTPVVPTPGGGGGGGTTTGPGTIPPIVITPVPTTPVTVATPGTNRAMLPEGTLSNAAYGQIVPQTMGLYGQYSGMPGQSDIGNFMKVLLGNQYQGPNTLEAYNQQLTRMANQQTQAGNTALRQANIGDVLGLSGMANAANRLSNTELYGLLGVQSQLAGQQLSTDWGRMQNQGALSGEDIRQGEQAAREAFASRGRLGDNSAMAAEVLNRDAIRRQREQEARANYQQSYANMQAPVAGYTANKFDPFSTILGGQYGQQTQNVGTNQNLFGQGSQFSSGALSNQFVQSQINPWSAYASDVYGSNFNAENARAISQANANAALQGANLNMIGQGTGALLGFLGKLWGGS